MAPKTSSAETYQASPASLAHDASPRSLLEPENRWLAVSSQLVLPPRVSSPIPPPLPPSHHFHQISPTTLPFTVSPPSPSSLPQPRHKTNQPKTHKNKPNSHPIRPTARSDQIKTPQHLKQASIPPPSLPTPPSHPYPTNKQPACPSHSTLLTRWIVYTPKTGFCTLQPHTEPAVSPCTSYPSPCSSPANFTSSYRVLTHQEVSLG